MIGRSDRIRTIGAVNADLALALAHGPLKRVEKRTKNKKDKEFRKDNMKRLFFLRSEFGFNIIAVLRNLRMVVTDHSSLKFGRVTDEVACKWHASVAIRRARGKSGRGRFQG
jgi:hypothetical protein